MSDGAKATASLHCGNIFKYRFVKKVWFVVGVAAVVNNPVVALISNATIAALCAATVLLNALSSAALGAGAAFATARTINSSIFCERASLAPAVRSAARKSKPACAPGPATGVAA